MAVVEPDRERVVADLPVEPASIRAAKRPLAQPAGRGSQLVAVQAREPFPTRADPVGRLVAGDEEDRRRARPPSRSVSRSTMPASKKTRIESWSGRTSQGVRRRHRRCGRRRARRSASASEAPSSPWKRSASAGVPHAGQPSTPKTSIARPSSARRERVAERRRRVRGPRGRRRARRARPPRRATRESKRFSQGMSTTRSRDAPRSASCSAATSASCSITGP